MLNNTSNLFRNLRLLEKKGHRVNWLWIKAQVLRKK